MTSGTNENMKNRRMESFGALYRGANGSEMLGNDVNRSQKVVAGCSQVAAISAVAGLQLDRRFTWRALGSSLVLGKVTVGTSLLVPSNCY